MRSHKGRAMQKIDIQEGHVELKIAESGEVLYRSVGAFKEYYKNPKAKIG